MSTFKSIKYGKCLKRAHPKDVVFHTTDRRETVMGDIFKYLGIKQCDFNCYISKYLDIKQRDFKY